MYVLKFTIRHTGKYPVMARATQVVFLEKYGILSKHYPNIREYFVFVVRYVLEVL